MSSLTYRKDDEAQASSKEKRVTSSPVGTYTGGGKRVTGVALLKMLNIEIEAFGIGEVARAMNIKSPRLSALRNAERPWTLDRLATLPDAVRIGFLRQWNEAEGVPASLANALRSMADAMDPQGRLPLIGEANTRR